MQKMNVVKLDQKTVKSLIFKAEERVGMNHEERNITIRTLEEKVIPGFIGEGYSVNLSVDGSYNPIKDEFILPKKGDEATGFHEAVHYLMHRLGILFSAYYPNLTLHDKFVDETIAELATSEEYGLRSIDRMDNVRRDYLELRNAFHNLLNELSVERRGDIHVIINGKKSTVKVVLSEMNRAISMLDNVHSRIVESQQRLEHEYSKRGLSRSAKTEWNSIIDFIYLDKELLPFYLVYSSMLIAAINSQRLNTRRITAQDLVSRVYHAQRNGENSTKIYFGTIIPLMYS